VMAHRTGSPASRPLCPYPAYPHYTGGDPDKASSFTCKTPA